MEKYHAKGGKITGTAGLKKMESKYRIFNDERIPYAKGTPYERIIDMIPDRDGIWANPLYLFTSLHKMTVGSEILGRKTIEFLEAESKEHPMDILSVGVGIREEKLCVVALIRAYGPPPRFSKLSHFLGEYKEVPAGEKETVKKEAADDRIVYTEEERASHREKIAKQEKAFQNATEEIPFLNAIDHYEPRVLPERDPKKEREYDLLTKDMQISTILPYEKFIKIFKECMSYVTTVEKSSYYDVIRGDLEKSEFMNVISDYIERTYIALKVMPIEDVPALLQKLNRALFELYIVQDLIDDPLITDVKIVDPYSVRVRIRGEAMLSNVTFIDGMDYVRFITSLAVKNRVDLSKPVQTFTDSHDKNYILRFSITADYVTESGYPIIHIRKISRNKLLAPDLIKAGMFDEKIRDYLLDCGKHSRGVVFAGPPGSGKTVCLNWFLEDAYESSAEILVIQENDELFTERKGVMFEHVVSSPDRNRGEVACSLEDLGQMALVAGANVFIIGEAKGAEICSAITLSNSGCRTAITIHSPSSTETIDKMADLAMRGYADSYDQALRMIKSFQTIVYLQDFKVQEISEVIGYDEVTRSLKYRPIYRRQDEKEEA